MNPLGLHSLNNLAWTLHPAKEIDGLPLPPGGIPALIPGNVQADLERALIIRPHRYGLGDPRWHDIARVGWIYTAEFDLSEERSSHGGIVFDGVDFTCEIAINGQLVGRNSGMYRRFTVDATHALQTGLNTIQVHIDPIPETITETLIASDGAQSGVDTADFFVYSNNLIRRAVKDLKSPATCSYDWATNTWALGIWRDVHFHATGNARIDDVWCRASPVDAEASVSILVTLEAFEAMDVRTTVAIYDPAGQLVAEVTTVDGLERGDHTIDLAATIQQPQLWWALGYGEQPLYRAEVRTSDARTGELLDAREVRFGVRSIAWEPVLGAPEGTGNFLLILNNTRIRTMGSNLVIPDILPGRSGMHATHLIEATATAGMNTLRIHGGGVHLPPSAYQRADELGLMIIQEFPLGNCLPESDPEFLVNLDATLRSIVRQVRNHPSIIEWSGGNELHWRESDDTPALETIRRVVREEDDRLVRATCPVDGGRHSPWDYDPATSYAHYNNPDLRESAGVHPLMRYGEFGTQSPAHVEVWHRDIPEQSRWPITRTDDPVLVRKNVTNAVFSEHHWLLLPLIERLFGLPRSLEAMIAVGQFIGAEGLRYACDALRRRGLSLGGFTTWDLNEPWPNGAGSYMIDHDGRPLMNYDLIKQSFAPLALSFEYGAIVVGEAGVAVRAFVVSDRPQPDSNLVWLWTARGLNGEVIASNGGGIESIQPHEVIEVDSVTIHPPRGEGFVLEGRLTDAAGATLGERVHLFGPSGPAPLSAFFPMNRRTPPSWLPDAGRDPANVHNLASTANGGEVVSVSGSEARDKNPVLALTDGAYMADAGGYSSSSAWHTTTHEGWFVIRLGQEARVTRVILGRDRGGTMHDRTLDRLRIEASADGTAWQPVAEFDQLAGRLGDRSSDGPGSRSDVYPATWSLDIALPPVVCRYLRFTVAGIVGVPKFVALDEVEVYADEGVGVTEAAAIIRDRSEPLARIEPTRLQCSLEASAADSNSRATNTPPGVSHDDEVIIRVSNQGKTTALFCTISPLLVYRPDLRIEGNNVSIPPGEDRTIRVSASRDTSLTLAELGWTVQCWNAPDIVLFPPPTLCGYVGRQDGTILRLDGRPIYVTQDTPFVTEFVVDDNVATVVVDVAVSDQSNREAASLLVLSGERHAGHLEFDLGYGHQADDPDALAQPALRSLVMSGDLVQPGRNRLVLEAERGWVAVDAVRVRQAD